jgi:hypothetical protein
LVHRALCGLFQERFKLTYRYDRRELSDCEIAVAKDGPKNFAKAHGSQDDPAAKSTP